MGMRERITNGPLLRSYRRASARWRALLGRPLGLWRRGATQLRSLRLPRYYRVAVTGESMSPTLHPGDYLVLRRGAPARSRMAGSLVSIRDATGRPLLKRIVGLPGELLQVGEGINVNGLPLVEHYARGATPGHQFRGANRLARDHYFLVGDNRTASTDSRDFGAVHYDRIDGVAVCRYWPPWRVSPIGRERRRGSTGDR